jgi:predicted ATPase/DNA-binding SARP family transcriptional activator
MVPSGPAPGRLRFSDLGPIEVWRGGDRVPVRGQRLTSILSLLLIRANQRVSTDAMVEALWGDEVTGQSRATLESHLWRLRRLLEPDRRRGEPFGTILHDTAGYRLAVTAEQADSMQFSRLGDTVSDLMLSGQPERALRRCDEALGMWRGTPWTPHDDEPWAGSAVAKLVETHQQLQEARVDCLLAAGDHGHALVEAEGMLQSHSLRERVWELAMLAAYRGGRTDHALALFTRARRVLIDEVGVEPNSALQDLQRRILESDPSLAGPQPTRGPARPRAVSVEVHLPQRRTELLGRASELAGITSLLREHPLVTIVGSAGCGKTRLAIDVARAASPSFPDGVWFIDLTAAVDAGQLLDAFTSTLGVGPAEAGTLTDVLKSFTRTRQMLLVLDNCEHLLDPVAELLDVLLEPGSELTVLATSREPMVLDVERLWSLSPLPAVADGADDDLRNQPAVQLFLQRLAVAAPHLTVTAADLRRVGEICSAVDSLPLAIELAAAQARSFALAEIASSVQVDPAGLARIGRGRDHHATLRGTIDLSAATLTDSERLMHQAIAVVPGPLTSDLASVLSATDVTQARTALSGLVHRSMLVASPPQREGGVSRFSQLATIRAHGIGAATLGQRIKYAERRNAGVTGLVSEVPPSGHPDESSWHGRLDDDQAAIRAPCITRWSRRPTPGARSSPPGSACTGSTAAWSRSGSGGCRSLRPVRRQNHSTVSLP